MPSTVPSSAARHAATRHVQKFAGGYALTTFVAPPAGFDPLTADPSTLRDHGYPDRPTEPAALAHWAEMLGTPLRHVDAKVTRHPGRHPSSVTEGSATSDIWSGAAVTTRSAPPFFSVTGRWNVPHITPFANGDDRHLSAWIGIDGFGNDVLLQSGFHAVMSSGDQHPDVYCWIEWLPDSENSIDLPIKVGDTLSCVVTRDQEVLTGSVQKGQWGVERPSENHVPQPLAGYGKVSFTHAVAMEVGGRLVKASLGENIAMKENGKIVSEGNAVGETVTCTFV